MPRNVRNFWVRADIEGREKTLAGGPVAKDGGIDMTILIRDGGEVSDAVEICGRCINGRNSITIRAKGHETIKIECPR